MAVNRNNSEMHEQLGKQNCFDETTSTRGRLFEGLCIKSANFSRACPLNKLESRD
jgi:hypothetical protein